MAMPQAVVAPQPQTKAPYGLFSQTQFRPNDGTRWLTGVDVDLRDRLDATMGIIDLNDICDTSVTNLKPGDADFPEAKFYAFTVYASSQCSPLVGRAEVQARAELNLLAQEEFEVEKKLWARLVLDTAASTAVSETTIAGLIAEMEKQGTANLKGSLGLFHADRNIALGMLMKVAETSGNRMRTKLGTPAVAGSGYGTEADTEDDTQVFFTSPLIAYRSDVYVPAGMDELFDAGTNDQYGFAARDYLIAYEPHATLVGTTSERTN